MKNILISALATIIFAPAAYAEEEAVTTLLRELCASGKVEGQYTQQETKTAKEIISLVCDSESTMVATIWQQSGDSTLTMGYVSLSGDTLKFLSASPNPGSRRLSPSEPPSPRLYLNILALRQGILSGSYKTLYLRQSEPVYAKRTKELPNMFSVMDPAVDFNRLEGRYSVDHPELLKGLGIVGPLVLTIENLEGMLSVEANDAQNFSDVLHNGLMATPSYNFHNIIYASVGVSIYGGSEAFRHIRGRLSRDAKGELNHLELFVFTTRNGIVGPFSAHRIPTPALPVPTIQKTL